MTETRVSTHYLICKAIHGSEDQSHTSWTRYSMLQPSNHGEIGDDNVPKAMNGTGLESGMTEVSWRIPPSDDHHAQLAHRPHRGNTQQSHRLGGAMAHHESLITCPKG
jgi:hypothetical protein